MKKKFASYLLTGKAATLPFYATSSIAETLQEHIAAHPPCLIELPSQNVEVVSSELCKKEDDEEVVARIVGCPGEKGKGPDVMTVVVVGLQAGDVVFVISSDDMDGYRDDWEPDFRLGKKNTRFAANFLVPPARGLVDIEDLIKEPLKSYRIGGSDVKSAGEAVSLPIDLAKIPNKDGFNLQAVVIREGKDGGDAKVLFSEMDKIERTVEADEECPILPDIGEEPCEPDSYGECTNGPDDPGPDDPYGGGGTTPGGGDSGTTTPGDGDGTTPGGGDVTPTPGGGDGSYGGGSY